MRQRLLNLDAIIEALKPYLQQYLTEHGINTSNSKNFKCLDPKHEDENASMHLYEDHAYCFGCGKTMRIFEAASILENKPNKGREWIEDNVLYLAKKYGIQTELADLTQEEIYEYRTYGAYKVAAELISDREFGNYEIIDKEMTRRGWDTEKCALWGIGTVNYDEFRDRLKKAGFEPKLLDGIGLSDATLFCETSLIFTVTDEEGRPVGFSAKRLDGGSGPRYTNSKQTGLECAIFKKSERLYGYDVAKDAPDPLYIFEGQANVITARHNGLMNCCCLMGTNLSVHHIALLKRYGSFNIVLVFDGDNAGRTALERAIDERFSQEKDFSIKLCQMPEGMDPDELIRKKGFDEFVRLKRWTAFEWRMFKFMEGIEGEINEEKKEEIANKMTPIIVAEKNYFRQEQMAKQIAKMTGYDLALVMAEVKRRRNEEEAEVQAKKVNLIEALAYQVRRNPDEAELALTECRAAVDNINKSVQIESETSHTLSTFLAVKETDEKKTGDFAGFYMRPDGIGGIGSRLDEDWKKDTLIYIGGGEQSAKTSLLSQMMYEIISNPKNDAVGLYFSIDDPARRIAYKWACNAADNLDLKLNWVSNPNYWAKEHGDIVYKLRDKGYRRLASFAKEGKLVLKDASDGTSLGYMRNVIRYHRERNPTANLLVGIDSFHKLSDYGEKGDTERTKRLSNDLKELTVSESITVACTAEYRKLAAGELPDNNALSQSKSLSYDADVILHLHNDLQVTDEQRATFIHEHDGKILPRIRCKFGKNKISGYIGVDFLDLFQYSARLKAVDKEQAMEEHLLRKQFLAENRDKII